MQSLPQAYVKVFVQMSDGATVFFKDGFTDIRGKFEYAKASGASSMKASSYRTFAIFVSDNDLGSLIKDADATKLRSEPQVVSSQPAVYPGTRAMPARGKKRRV